MILGYIAALVIIAVLAFIIGTFLATTGTEKILNDEHAECMQSLRDEYEDGEGQVTSNLLPASDVCGMTHAVLDRLTDEVQAAEGVTYTGTAAGAFFEAVRLADELNLIDYDR